MQETKYKNQTHTHLDIYIECLETVPTDVQNTVIHFNAEDKKATEGLVQNGRKGAHLTTMSYAYIPIIPSAQHGRNWF